MISELSESEEVLTSGRFFKGVVVAEDRGIAFFFDIIICHSNMKSRIIKEDIKIRDKQVQKEAQMEEQMEADWSQDMPSITVHQKQKN